MGQSNINIVEHSKRNSTKSRHSGLIKNKFKKNRLLFANIAIILAVTGFVFVGQNTTSGSKSFSLVSSTGGQLSDVPLDTLSSADIAANVALATSMPQEVMVINQADSFKAQLAKASTEEAVIAKPQVVTGGAASVSDIVNYVAQDGDTTSSLAAKFGVSSDSIKWSNDLSDGPITSGTKLKIPPADGVIYTVDNGDTVDSLAAKYSADKTKLVAFNDVELTGIKKGDTLFIPGGVKPAPTPVYNNTGSSSSSSTSSNTYGFVARYGGNGYSYGYCTWYAASRVPVPSNWGNANTWDDYARSSGWTVSSVPKVGAVAQTDGMSWWGHVAVVEEVSADGTQIKYSDMNALAGWNRVGYSGWVPSTFYQNYIYQ